MFPWWIFPVTLFQWFHYIMFLGHFVACPPKMETSGNKLKYVISIDIMQMLLWYLSRKIHENPRDICANPSVAKGTGWRKTWQRDVFPKKQLEQKQRRPGYTIECQTESKWIKSYISNVANHSVKLHLEARLHRNCSSLGAVAGDAVPSPKGSNSMSSSQGCPQPSSRPLAWLQSYSEHPQNNPKTPNEKHPEELSSVKLT